MSQPNLTRCKYVLKQEGSQLIMLGRKQVQLKDEDSSSVGHNILKCLHLWIGLRSSQYSIRTLRS